MQRFIRGERGDLKSRQRKAAEHPSTSEHSCDADLHGELRGLAARQAELARLAQEQVELEQPARRSDARDTNERSELLIRAALQPDNHTGEQHGTRDGSNAKRATQADGCTYAGMSWRKSHCSRAAASLALEK